VLVFAYFTSGINSLQRKFTEPFVGLQIGRLFFSTLSFADEPSKILTYLIVNEKPVGVETAERAITCRGIWNIWSPLECDLKRNNSRCSRWLHKYVWYILHSRHMDDRVLQWQNAIGASTVVAGFEYLKSLHFFFRLYRMPPGISQRSRYLMVHINRPVQRYSRHWSKVNQGTDYVTELGRPRLQLITRWHVH